MFPFVGLFLLSYTAWSAASTRPLLADFGFHAEGFYDSMTEPQCQEIIDKTGTRRVWKGKAAIACTFQRTESSQGIATCSIKESNGKIVASASYDTDEADTFGFYGSLIIPAEYKGSHRWEKHWSGIAGIQCFHEQLPSLSYLPAECEIGEYKSLAPMSPIHLAGDSARALVDAIPRDGDWVTDFSTKLHTWGFIAHDVTCEHRVEGAHLNWDDDCLIYASGKHFVTNDEAKNIYTLLREAGVKPLPVYQQPGWDEITIKQIRCFYSSPDNDGFNHRTRYACDIQE